MDGKKIISINIKKYVLKILLTLVVSFIIIISASDMYSTKDVKTHSSLESFTKHLNKRIPKLMKEYNIAGVSIAIINEGKTSWTNAYGYADLENNKKMAVDTICRTQSISKSVTAWGVMKLVQDGKLGLDDRVKQYIKNWDFPEAKYSVENITVRQLLSHTGGMPLGTIGVHYSPFGEVPTLEDNLYSQARLVKEPNSSFLYSNVGFNLLELLIEEVTHRDFAEYMENEVLKPLGMKNSSYNWSEDFNVPTGYDLNNKSVPVYIYPEKGSGGLFGTVEDVAKFVGAGMINSTNTENNVLKLNNIKELYSPIVEVKDVYDFVSETYGLGHFIETLSDGSKAVFHGGQGHGWMTHFHSVPVEGKGIVILTNSQKSWPFISYILSDWAKWNGYESIGMGIIITGIKIVWFIIGFIIFISLLLLWNLIEGIIKGQRRFTLLSRRHLALRIIQSVIFIILTSLLIWCKKQDYLFIYAVFPNAANWIEYSSVLLAITMFLQILFPNSIYKKIEL